MISSSNRVWVIIAIIFASILAVQGVKANRVLGDKSQSQEEVTEYLHRWKKDYVALGQTVKRWETSYRHQDAIQDIMTLVSTVNFGEYGMTVNADTISLYKTEQATQNGMQIGLTRLCLASNGISDAASVEVQAKNYQALFAGLKRLVQRPDISVGTVSIRGDKPVPVASLGDFCVLLRKG